ncbi:Uncharacterized protein conserved in bacteria [Pragia fontium]|uniref:SPOR domain-containing protein n=1 Tax=Pragia fontium TaxID=82985 RepID=UPI000DFF3C72|nr:SPOR domain-containing protein [Pragia fontium]SUB81093.1 Uncharacterized protein conserved in bacteria [Pragia fontium]
MREEDQENFESDEIRPDISDRAPRRERSKPQKSPMVSRQHIKIGLGVLVLLLLIFLISSALKSPAPQDTGPREVNLGNTSDNTSQPATQTSGQQTEGVVAPGTAPTQPVSPPPVSGTPTQSQPLPETPNQQRVEIPGEITDALSAQQEQLNRLKETEMPGSAPASTTTSKPDNEPVKAPAQATQPASTASPNASNQVNQAPHKTSTSSATSTPKANESSTVSTAKGSTTPGTTAALSAIPGSRVTLQVSSASRSDTLLAFAKKNGMKDYWVYSTRRNDKPWFVLVTGSYASAAEARAALSGMSNEVQANKPWVRSMQQVHQDLKQK